MAESFVTFDAIHAALAEISATFVASEGARRDVARLTNDLVYAAPEVILHTFWFGKGFGTPGVVCLCQTHGTASTADALDAIAARFARRSQ